MWQRICTLPLGGISCWVVEINGKVFFSYRECRCLLFFVTVACHLLGEVVGGFPSTHACSGFWGWLWLLLLVMAVGVVLHCDVCTEKTP